jgi:hypothetical protein
MHPSPKDETSKLLFPSLRFFIVSPQSSIPLDVNLTVPIHGKYAAIRKLLKIETRQRGRLARSRRLAKLTQFVEGGPF